MYVIVDKVDRDDFSHGQLPSNSQWPVLIRTVVLLSTIEVFMFIKIKMNSLLM